MYDEASDIGPMPPLIERPPYEITGMWINTDRMRIAVQLDDDDIVTLDMSTWPPTAVEVDTLDARDDGTGAWHALYLKHVADHYRTALREIAEDTKLPGTRGTHMSLGAVLENIGARAQIALTEG